jgi:putative transposase
MPRKPRLDVQGTLHHIIVRGIERIPIFKDDQDRQRFIDRLEKLVDETGTKIYAWALIPNHFHLLVRSGSTGLSTFMRRLLTGYAISFNKRHNRAGHLFQNRYKSIICDEEPYFLQLVRYIHLNPLRSHVVESFDHLGTYAWSGHRALIGKARIPWQDCNAVLLHFSKTEKRAQSLYMSFVEKGAFQGHRPDLTGGGLIRSVGGIREALSYKKEGDRVLTDDRVLGQGEFVRILLEQKEKKRPHLSLSERISKMEQIISKRCDAEGITTEALVSGSRAGTIPKIRADLAKQLVQELGISYAEIARHLGISTARVSKIITDVASYRS